MPYARQNYNLFEVEKMLEGSVNASVATQKEGRTAPNPHAGVHVPQDELHKNKLFQKARVTTGTVGTHSVVSDSTELASNLLKAMNAADMQPFLAKLDPKPPRVIDPTWHPNRKKAVETQNTNAARNPEAQKDDIWVNINFSVGQSQVSEFKDDGTGTVGSRSFAYQCLGVKLMANPHNRDVPILQTCVPMENPVTTDLHFTVA
jgi:hypothetical protein